MVVALAGVVAGCDASTPMRGKVGVAATSTSSAATTAASTAVPASTITPSAPRAIESPATPVAVIDGRYRLVTRTGNDLVETSSDGTARVVATLADVTTTVTPTLSGMADRLLVTYGGHTVVYDTRVWGDPIGASDHYNVGTIATATGFWAGRVDAPADGQPTVTWQRRDWRGVPFGPSFNGPWSSALPFGAITDGLVLWRMDDAHIFVLANGAVHDVGAGHPIATGGNQIAYQPRDGAVTVFDAATGRVRVLDRLDGRAPAQTLGAGAFAPDGHALALATSDASPPYASHGVVVYDLDARSSSGAAAVSRRRFDTIAAYAVTWTPDSSHVIASDHTGIASIDPVTGDATYPVRWNDDETFDVVVLTG